MINFFRRRFGLGYWSLSAYVKQRVKDAVSFIGKFEAAVVKYAERYRVEAVLCGHIHSVSIREFGSITYYNCGDWVETCSALVEHFDGRIEIVRGRATGKMPVGPTAKMAVLQRCLGELGREEPEQFAARAAAIHLEKGNTGL